MESGYCGDFNKGNEANRLSSLTPPPEPLSTRLKPKVKSTLTEWLEKIAARSDRLSTLIREVGFETSLHCHQIGHAVTAVPPCQDRSPVISLAVAQSTDEENPSASPLTISERLLSCGYSSLANYTKHLVGYPWSCFEKVNCLPLLIQLTHLYQQCCAKKLTAAESKIVFDFALQIIPFAESAMQKGHPSSEALVQETIHFLGQLLYLIDASPTSILPLLDLSNIPQTLENIDINFRNHMEIVCKRIETHYQKHKKTALQDPEIALRMHIPIEISNVLMLSHGIINFGIIDYLSLIFLTSRGKVLNHQLNLAHGLKMLKKSIKLRDEIEKIKAPQDASTISIPVINIALGLENDHIPTAEDTKKCALIALLSHLRQGNDRGCFAVSIAIEIKTSHLLHCLQDIKQLLEEGRLTRRLKGTLHQIPFRSRINDASLDKKIRFDRQGRIIDDADTSQRMLAESPGIISACRALGIQDVQKVLENITTSSSSVVQIMEVRDVLMRLAERQQTPDDTNLGSPRKKFNIACFAYSKETASPVLKIWENAIANLPEADREGMITRQILHAIVSTIQEFLIKEKRFALTHVSPFMSAIADVFLDTTHLEYDPTLQDTATIHKSKEGGFILYNKHIKIDRQEKFQEFLTRLFTETKQALLEREPSHETKEIEITVQMLIDYFSTNEALENLLIAYCTENIKPLRQQRQKSLSVADLRFTPWITLTGNDSKKTLKMYFESEQVNTYDSFVGRTGKESLSFILDLCKKMTDNEKTSYLINPHMGKPFCVINNHRLLLMPGHETMMNAWRSSCSTEEFITEQVQLPGNRVAESEATEIFRSNLRHQLLKDFKKLQVHAHDLQAVEAIFNTLRDKMTIKSLRAHLITSLKQMVWQKGTMQEDRMIRHLDTLICASLEEKLMEEFKKSFIHIADTNWCDGIHDIHFCFAVNPGNGEIELFEVQDDGENIVALDQKCWLIDQKWEFYSSPLKPLEE